MSTAQATLLRVPLADGTLVATSDLPAKELIPSLLAHIRCSGHGLVCGGRCQRKARIDGFGGR